MSSPLKIHQFPISQTIIRIGSAEQNEVVLEETEEQYQCKLVKMPIGWELIDCSGKGTWVDGERIEQRLLDTRARIEIDDLHLRLCELKDQILLIASRAAADIATILVS